MGIKRIALLAMFLILAACGGEDTSTEPTVGDDPATTATSAVDPTLAPNTTVAGVEAPQLAGTSWMVKDYKLASGAITNVWKTDVTISFEDQTVSGSAGCNTYSGIWTTTGPYDPHESGQRDANDGQAVSISDLAWTEIGCDQDIMEQEGEILDHLNNTGRWLISDSDGSLNLRDAEGNFLLNANPAG